MPTSALLPCPEPGCPELTPGGCCPDHRRQRNALRAQQQKGLYGRRHQKWRRLVLLRHPICRGWPPGTRCLTPSTVADHIVPLKHGGARYALENGQGLCAACHNRKTGAGL